VDTDSELEQMFALGMSADVEHVAEPFDFVLAAQRGVGLDG
jgi:tetrahydromethanopterin S-methyltransferase subunit F